MKNHYYLLLGAIALMVATVYSCSSLPGDCPYPPEVTSGNAISRFNAKSDSVTIKIANNGGGLAYIIFSDTNNKRRILANRISYDRNLRIFENDTCYVHLRDNSTLFIKMKENTTKLTRTINVDLFAGNCGIPEIKVVQAAE